MNTSYSKFLPAGMRSRVVAVWSYIVAGIGIWLSVSYFLGPGDTCIAPNIADLVRLSIVMGVVQLIVSVRVILFTLRLNQPSGRIYKLILVIATLILLCVQLLVAMGYGFGVGTACTT